MKNSKQKYRKLTDSEIKQHYIEQEFKEYGNNASRN